MRKDRHNNLDFTCVFVEIDIHLVNHHTHYIIMCMVTFMWYLFLSVAPPLTCISMNAVESGLRLC